MHRIGRWLPAPNAADIPAWLRKPPKGQQPNPAYQFGQNAPRRETGSPQPQSGKTATAGIIIATIVALGFWFWFGIGVAAVFNPPEPESVDLGDFRDRVYVEGNYLGPGRAWFAIAVSVVMTALT